jgi:hypothetical protein
MSSAELDRIRSGSLSGSTVEFGKIISNDGATIKTGDLAIGDKKNKATVHVNGKDVTNTLIAGGTDHFDNGIYLKDANMGNTYRRIYAYTTQQGENCIRSDKDCTFVAAKLQSNSDSSIRGNLEICQTNNPVQGQPPINHEFIVNNETVVDENNKGTFNGVNLKNGNYNVDIGCEDQSNRLKVNGVNIGNAGLKINGTGTNPANMHMINITGGGIQIDKGSAPGNVPIYYDITLNNEKVLGGKREAYLEKVELYPAQGPGKATVKYDNSVKIDQSIDIGDATTQLTLKLNGNPIATKAAAFDGVLDKNDLKVGTAQNKKKVIVNGNDVITDDSKVTAKSLVITSATGSVGTTITSDKQNNTSMTGTFNIAKLNVANNTAAKGTTNTKLYGDVEIGENNSQYKLKINGKELAPFDGTYTGNVTIKGTQTVTQNSTVSGKLTIDSLEMKKTNILTETGKANLQSIKLNDYTNKKTTNIICDKDGYTRIEDDNKQLSGLTCGHFISSKGITSLDGAKISSGDLLVEKGTIKVKNVELKNFDGKLTGADLELDAGKTVKIGGVPFKPNFDGQLNEELHVIKHAATIDGNLTVGDANNNSSIWLNGKTVLEGDSQADLKKISLISTKDNNKNVEMTYDQDYNKANRVNVNGDLFANALSSGFDDKEYDAARISGNIEIVTGKDVTTKAPIYRSVKFNDKEVLTGKAHAHFNELEICTEDDKDDNVKISAIKSNYGVELRSEKPILIANTSGLSIAAFDDKTPHNICAQKIKYKLKGTTTEKTDYVLYTPGLTAENIFAQNLLKIGQDIEFKVVAGKAGTNANDEGVGVNSSMVVEDAAGISLQTDDTSKDRYATLKGITVTDTGGTKRDMLSSDYLKANKGIYIGDKLVNPDGGGGGTTVAFDGKLPDNDLIVGKAEVENTHVSKVYGFLNASRVYKKLTPTNEDTNKYDDIIDENETIVENEDDDTITKSVTLGYNSKQEFIITSSPCISGTAYIGTVNSGTLTKNKNALYSFGDVKIGALDKDTKSEFVLHLNTTDLTTNADNDLVINNGGLNIPTDKKINIGKVVISANGNEQLFVEGGGIQLHGTSTKLLLGSTTLEPNGSGDLVIDGGNLRLSEGKTIYIGNEEFKGGNTFDGKLPKNDLVIGSKDESHYMASYGPLYLYTKVETKEENTEDDTIIKGNVIEETTDEDGYVIKGLGLGINKDGNMMISDAQFGSMGTMYVGGANETTKKTGVNALVTFGDVRIGDDKTAYKLYLNGKEFSSGSNVFNGKVVIENKTNEENNDIEEYATLQVGNTELTTDENNDMIINNKLSLCNDGMTVQSKSNPDVSVALSAFSQESSTDDTIYKGLYAENFIAENLLARNKVYTVENDDDGNKTKLVELKNFDGKLKENNLLVGDVEGLDGEVEHGIVTHGAAYFNMGESEPEGHTAIFCNGDLKIGDGPGMCKLYLNGTELTTDKSVDGNFTCSGSIECNEMITLIGQKYYIDTDGVGKFKKFKSVILAGTNEQGDGILTVGSSGTIDAPVTLVHIPTNTTLGYTDKSSTITLTGTVKQNDQDFLDTDGNMHIRKINFEHSTINDGSLYGESGMICSSSDIRFDKDKGLMFQYEQQGTMVNASFKADLMKMKSGGTGRMGIYTPLMLADTFYQQGSNANDAVVYDMSYNPETNSCTNEDGTTTTYEDYPNTFNTNVVSMGSIIASGENNVIGVGLCDDKDKQTYMTATSLHTKRTYTDSITPVEDTISIGDSSTNYKLTLNGKNVQVAEGAEFTSLKLISEDGTKYVEVAKNASVDDGITVKGAVDVGSDLNVYGTVVAKKAKIEALENLNTFTYTATIKTRSDATSTKDATVTVTLERIIGNLRRCTIKQSGDNNVADETWSGSNGMYYVFFTPSEEIPDELKPTDSVLGAVSIISPCAWKDENKSDWTNESVTTLFGAVGTGGQAELLFMRDNTTELACTSSLPTISFFY